jgi:hypothetical protein
MSSKWDKPCEVCGKIFRGRSNMKLFTCSSRCSGIRKTGVKRPGIGLKARATWIANGNKQACGPDDPRFLGRKLCNGYYWVWCEERSEYVAEHRLVMSRYLRRNLTPQEIVHHINRDKTDNRLENLELMSKAEHMEEHRKEIRACL